MKKRFLVKVILMKGYNKVEIFQHGKKVRANGNFALPSVLAEFETPEEAKAYILGINWAIKYYGGEVNNYMKDIECE